MAEMVSGRLPFDYVESRRHAKARAIPASRVNACSQCFRHAAKRYFNLRLLARERPEFDIVECRTLTVDFALLSYALVGLERPVRRSPAVSPTQNRAPCCGVLGLKEETWWVG